MAQSTTPSTSLSKYYFIEESSKIVYWSNDMLENLGNLVFIGISDNARPKSAVASFMVNSQIPSGYRVRPLNPVTS